MSKLSVNGIDFHYWTTGEGPDLIMLHGIGGNLAVWHLKMVPLLRQNYRVTTYDLRGHGRTGAPPTGYTTAHMADDLLGLMDGLGIEQAHFVGHSLGADIILHFGLRYPDRINRMVLVEPGLPALLGARQDASWIGWDYWSSMIEKYTDKPVPEDKRTDWKYLLRRSFDVPILFGPAQGNARNQDKFYEVLETTTLVDDYEVVGELTLENIGTVPHPKLLIYDKSSPYIGTFDALCEVVQNCQPVLLSSGELRHFLPLEKPELLVEYIQTFVSTDDAQLEEKVQALTVKVQALTGKEGIAA